ncbi:MAG: CoA pyrophosphatase [Oleiphilaceae bacterium]|nr:CoA pyrophosphatase [Oleiphilaceae bacterium]
MSNESPNLIDVLVDRLQTHQPRNIETDLPDAGILVPVTRNGVNPEIILTRRAEHLSTHKGQVAFPGGKFDEEDGSTLQTALRECHEEIGIHPDQVEVVGQLSQVVSLHGIRVTPYVGIVDEGLPLTPNPDELDAVFQVPASYLQTAEPKRRDRMTYKGMALSVPSYDYDYEGQNYEIWGLSAIVLVELLNVAFDYDIHIFDEPNRLKTDK